jgi:seryl-tRNA synthetase
MHDIRRIRENNDIVKKSILRKGFDADIDLVLSLDNKWRDYTRKADDLKAELNRASRAIGEAKKAGSDAKDEMEAARKIRDDAASIDDEKRKIKSEVDTLLLSFPSEPDESVPEGLTENENVIYKDTVLPEKRTFKPKEHLTLSEGLGILDMPRGAKISGSGWPLYVGQGATLERALVNYMLDIQTREHGYTELFVPFAVNRESVTGTAQLPKLEEDMYYMEKDDLFLIPTAEVPITNMYRNEILKDIDLPIKNSAYSACFRREAGAYGAETRGLLRIHQFNKVELVQIVHPDKSSDVQLEILSHATKILDNLGITYRILELCCGELSFGATKCYDIEVWAPGTGSWLEASSVSNFKDFQSRRMNLRCKPSEVKAKTFFPHTLNGSGLATSRLMVALLETYQNEDGTISVPEPLKGYLGGLETINGVSK